MGAQEIYVKAKLSRRVNVVRQLRAMAKIRTLESESSGSAIYLGE